VSGAAAKTTDLENRDGNATIWQDDQTEGFVWIELEGNTATVAFYDMFGNLDHTGSFTK
jgi:hypothetical protein